MAHGLSCFAACGIFPDQGSIPCPLHWQADSQPLCHQKSPLLLLECFLNSKFLMCVMAFSGRISNMYYSVDSILHFVLLFYHLVLFYQFHFSKFCSVNLWSILLFSSLGYFFLLGSSHQSVGNIPLVNYVDCKYSPSCHSVSFHLAHALCSVFLPLCPDEV